uniref:tyrosine-type recombinase/integrase n=1 Tax=Enterocloster aldenensis TaxID=358742 RepID=UPI0022E37EEB
MALIQCPECEGKVSDRASSCPHCGFPLSTTAATAPVPKRGRPKKQEEPAFRLPNGYGTIRRLTGNRRKPYVALVNPTQVFNDEKGTSHYKYDLLGTFAEKIDAYNAVMQYHKSPGGLNSNITVKDLFNKWVEHHMQVNNYPDSMRKKYEMEFAYLSPLYKIRVLDTSPATLKEAIENASKIGTRGKTKGQVVAATPNMKSNIKGLLNMMYDHAIFLRILTVNYARTFELKFDIVRREGRPYTQAERDILWRHSGTLFIDMTLVQFYSGWRPNEVLNIGIDNVDLQNRTFTSGSKTEAGINRTVPIHSKIIPIIEHYYKEAHDIGRNVLFGRTSPHNGQYTYTDNSFRYGLFKDFDELGIKDHVLHDGRHTFSTMAKENGVDDFARKKFMGHNISDLTDRVYTHLDLEWFRTEIEKIK